MKKNYIIIGFLMINIFVLTPTQAQSDLNPHSPKTQSIIQQLKAQFFQEKTEQYEQKKSILERIKEYFDKKTTNKKPTDPVVKKPSLSTEIPPIATYTPHKNTDNFIIPALTRDTIPDPEKKTVSLNNTNNQAFEQKIEAIRNKYQLSPDLTNQAVLDIYNKKGNVSTKKEIRSDDTCMDPNSTNPKCKDLDSNQSFTKKNQTQSTNIDLKKLQERYPNSKLRYDISKPFVGDTRKAPESFVKNQTKDPTWTQWMNRDSPSGTGDWEQYKNFQKLYPGICPEKFPIDTECQTVSGKNYTTTQQVINRCNYDGFICENTAQQGGTCEDYKVRFLCGNSQIPKEKSTETPPINSTLDFENNIDVQNPNYVPTNYQDTITRDADTTSYQYGCTTSEIDGICDRYQLKTSQGEIDPYQKTNYQAPSEPIENKNMSSPSTGFSEREQALFKQNQSSNNTPTNIPESITEKLQRFSGESDYKARQRAQNIMKMFKNR